MNPKGDINLKHLFRKGNDPTKPTLLLLHGTGGTEQDLLPLAEIIDPNANVLSVRGNVLENGMPRFFKRLAEGVFDEEDLIFRTKELNEFLDEAAEKYNFDRKQVIAVGYSNGANIAASLLFHYQQALKGAILHHPMVPRRGIELPDLNGTPVFIGAGTNDPICPSKESQELQALLEQAGANVHLHWENRGHQLTSTEVDAAREWYLTI
nr:alpha/beta hydrolase [Lederbergia galactosidilytica]